VLKKIIIVLLIFGIFSCSATIKEDKFIAQSTKIKPYSQDMFNNWQQKFPEHTLTKVSIKSKDDGSLLQGIYLDNKNSNDVVFIIPGNGMEVEKGGISMLLSLTGLATDLVIFDRRGLGASSGKASINNLMADANQQYQFIKDELHADRVIIHGYSLGSFIAAQLAKQKPIDALVLQGSATNIDDWVDTKMPWYVAPFLTVNIDAAFSVADNKQVVAHSYDKPLLIIAGENDQKVPAELSKQLYDASQSINKTLVMVKGASHGGMFDDPETLSAYLHFLSTI
jgi:pimeloyl-ACP methyl ester carboxylesterase